MYKQHRGKSTMNKLQILLRKHGLYYSQEELVEAKDEGFLELVGKANGDSYGIPVDQKFGEDYSMLMKLLNEHKIEIAEEVWFD